MAGFFGMFDYSRPGRGVDKDAPQKRGFFLFFDILFRKFWRIVTLSCAHALVSLPSMVIYFFLAMLWQSLFRVWDNDRLTVYVSIYATLLLTSFISAGPAGAGLCYVLRNFSRESHAWVWDDYWSHVKENLGKGLVVFLLDIIIIVGLVSAAYLYFVMPLPLPPLITAFLGFFTLIMLAVYIMMHSFLYVLMVTYDMKFGQLFRTAMQLTLAKLFPCAVVYILALVAFAAFLTLYFINVAFLTAFVALGFAFVPFIYFYYATSVVDAYNRGE